MALWCGMGAFTATVGGFSSALWFAGPPPIPPTNPPPHFTSLKLMLTSKIIISKALKSSH